MVFYLLELVSYNLPLIFWFWLLVILQLREMDADPKVMRSFQGPVTGF